MIQDYYLEYYNYERNHWWFQAREQIIVNFLRKEIQKNFHERKDLKILNIGCSTGRTSEFLSIFGNVTSIEYDEYCCEFARQKTGLKIIHGSITELPFEENSFDLVCAFDVIEHVEDDLLAVSQMKKVAKQNAIIMITVPALMSLWSHHDEINFHFRRYRLKEVKRLFEKEPSGKEIFSSYFNSLLFLPIYGYRKLSNLLKLGEKRKGAGSDFEAFNTGILNTILYSVMKTEGYWINLRGKFPIGISILYSYKMKK